MGHNAVAALQAKEINGTQHHRVSFQEIAPLFRRFRLLESRQLSADFHEVVGQRDHFQPDPSARDAYK